MRAFAKGMTLLVMAGVLCSCAVVSLKETWRNPTIQPHRVHKLVVVTVGKKDSNRRVYEEVIAAELNKRGVAASTGFSLVPGEDKMDWPILEEALRKVAVDSVITVQTTGVEKQTVVQPYYSSTYPGYWYPPAFPSWSLYGYYGASMYYEPPYISTYELATIQVNLFDTQSGKLIWAATLESSEPGKVTEVSKELADVIAKELVKENLI